MADAKLGVSNCVHRHIAFLSLYGWYRFELGDDTTAPSATFFHLHDVSTLMPLTLTLEWSCMSASDIEFPSRC